MDQSAHTILYFDRFTLDLRRGCLRQGEREIDLRPKAFEVLRYLADNAGRLVSKQELFAAVWPGLSVTDDSLVQCIRALRDKLGDSDHHLIKTFHRRGYLLDANVTTSPGQSRPGTGWQTDGTREIVPVLTFASRRWKLLGGIATVVLLFLAFGIIYSPKLLARTQFLMNSFIAPSQLVRAPIVSEVYSGEVARRVAKLSANKQLPLPPFKIDSPPMDVPDQVRRYVGIWVSDDGWIGSGRQMMLIVTEVNRVGVAKGYVVLGPPKPKSPVQDVAHAYLIKAHILGDTFSYITSRAEFLASLDERRRIRLRATYRNGLVGEVWLYPVWTPSSATGVEAPKTSG